TYATGHDNVPLAEPHGAPAGWNSGQIHGPRHDGRHRTASSRTRRRDERENRSPHALLLRPNEIRGQYSRGTERIPMPSTATAASPITAKRTMRSRAATIAAVRLASTSNERWRIPSA